MYFAAFAVVARLATRLVSKQNERALKWCGVEEIGACTSAQLRSLRLAFYVLAILEAVRRNPAFDAVATIGMAVYGLGLVALVTVIALLGEFWTEKLIIASDQRLLGHWLFRMFRHPHYILATLPELIGFALVLHAFLTLFVFLPLYCLPLLQRVRQEEAVMRRRFPLY